MIGSRTIWRLSFPGRLWREHGADFRRKICARIGLDHAANAVAVILLVMAPCTLLAQAASSTSRTTILDRVVAVVGPHAVLASDVDEEMRFAAFQPAAESPADNTPRVALNRVINRVLIDQERALQPGLAEVSPQQIKESIENLRLLIPACVPYDCKTDSGWQAFLQAHGFTEPEVEDRMRERLAILKFIDLRFGVAARAPREDVQKYYDEVLKPQLERSHVEIPEFRAVAPRIREILRQQQVNIMVDQWLKSLRSEDNVRIVDAAYGNPGDSQ